MAVTAPPERRRHGGAASRQRRTPRYYHRDDLRRSADDRLLGGLVWGGRDLLASSHAASYFTFENAFPAADGWLALTLLLGALGLALNRSWGLLWGLLAGGAGIYLGCMDVLFDLENGIYLVPKGGDPSAVIIEASINVLTFTLGVVVITYLWRQRRWLLAQGG